MNNKHLLKILKPFHDQIELLKNLYETNWGRRWKVITFDITTTLKVDIRFGQDFQNIDIYYNPKPICFKLIPLLIYDIQTNEVTIFNYIKVQWLNSIQLKIPRMLMKTKEHLK